MGYKNEKLWKILIEKCTSEDENRPVDRQIANEYLTGVESVCQFGVERAATIRDTFPMYTRHDEVHICNVMRLMYDILGDEAQKLSRDETAMLVMAACCHDIGMSYSEAEKEDILADTDRLNQYLNQNRSEYVKAYNDNSEKPHMTNDMIQNYLRHIHHERAKELLCRIEWPFVLSGKVDCNDLINICRSHGINALSLNNYDFDSTPTIDLRFCAVLLRLADILDFDTSRAPKAVYDYSGFNSDNKSSSFLKSKEEWDKHLSSNGFDFEHVGNREYPYDLPYSASCKAMQVEQTINSYLDWVDEELNNCGRLFNHIKGKWESFVLPGKIKRKINAIGYVSGQYKLTLDSEQVLELLVGKDIYSDASVFVRELIQNAIDAVRTRKQLDRDLPFDWKPQINIRTWMDNEGYHWFRIEDNGIGMTEDIIKNYLLRIGSSYYTSDDFKQSKIKCRANMDYMPISRFGIGILSCFMGDKNTNRVEISTKRFNENGEAHSALRMSMQGMSGYYYMASHSESHKPGEMYGVTKEEKKPYLNNPGTVIAVRTNLYQTGSYKGFKEIVDKYVMFPEVHIHYDGNEGSFDYPTEKEFMDAVNNINPSDDLSKKGVIEFELSEEQINSITSVRPEIKFEKPPKITLKCVALSDYTDSPYISGAMLLNKVEMNCNSFNFKLKDQLIEAKTIANLRINPETDLLSLRISLSFDNKSHNKIESIKKDYDDIIKKRKEVAREFINSGKDFDKIYFDIGHAIMFNEEADHLWQQGMTEKYGITKEELNNKIQYFENLFNIGLTQDEQKDINFLKVYRSLSQKWKFPICYLNKYKWYVKYFKSIYLKTSMSSITVHNGILCGDGNFFSIQYSYSYPCIFNIILLKDKYRPDLDISRSNIRQISLEMESEFAIIKSQLNKQKFVNLSGRNNIYKRKYMSIPLKELWGILDNHPRFIKHLIIYTEYGPCNINKLHSKIKETDKLKIRDLPNLCSDNRDLYNILCTALLLRNFSLKSNFNGFSYEIYITEKKENIVYENTDILPIPFFIENVDNYDYLTGKWRYSRNSINSNHPLTRFIKDNCITLNEHVPGIFFEMLRTLSEDDGDDIIKNMNGLLDRLRNLPNGIIKVPIDLRLTDDDFNKQYP